MPSEPRPAPGADPERNFALIATLPGFLDLDAYRLFGWLAELNRQPGLAVLEIGVFCGRSLAALATVYPDADCHGVDPFFADFVESPAFADEAAILGSKTADAPDQRIARLQAVLAALDRQNGTAIAAHLRLHRMLEQDFYRADRGRYQLLHVDGEHTFAAVAGTLDRLETTLAPSGWLVVDDFLHPGFPDISEAVHRHRLFRTRLSPVAYAFNKGVFALTDPGDARLGAWRDEIARRCAGLGFAVRRMHDGAVALERPVGATPKPRSVPQRLARKAGRFGRRLRRAFGG